ncbi:hypothetical protein ACCT04_36415, partial [Rhizobium ruizarguesonis]
VDRRRKIFPAKWEKLLPSIQNTKGINMKDAKTFGSEIAALAMGKLKHIALSSEDDATKAIKVNALNTSVGHSLALGRGAA